MDYLFVTLFWYVLIAFAIGLFVGWVSCGRTAERRGRGDTGQVKESTLGN